MCWSLFLIKLQAFRAATLLKKTPTQVFSCAYCEFLSILKSANGWFWLFKMFIEIRLCNPVNPYHFKGHVKIVEIYMVKLNVSILNRLKMMGFFVNAKYIRKHVISNKTVTKLFTILTKWFFFQIWTLQITLKQI